MKRFLISTTSILALALPVAAFAADAPTPDITDKTNAGMDEIVVSATRTAQPLYRIGSSVTVVTEQAIQSSQTVIVSDLISQLPGVSLSRAGGVGGTTSLRIRGAETDQTVVVIDGVKLNDPSSTGGGYNFANMVVGDIQRIELLRGAQSTLWGSQAIGGVINIITADPTKPFEGSAEAEGGSFGTAYGKAGIGGADGKLTWNLGGGYYTTDGVSAFAGGKENDGYHNTNASGRVRYDLTDAFSIDLRGVYSYAHNQFDGFPAPAFAFADTAEYGTTAEFLGYAGANFALLDGRLKNRVAYAYTNTKRDNFNPDQTVTTSTFDAKGLNKRWEYQGSFAVNEAWSAVFGAEHEASSFRTASPSSFTPNPAPAIAKVGITSGYGQVQGDVVTGLTLTGGLRVDDHDTFGSRVLGQAAAAWSLDDGTSILRASFGQGFKAPTLYQLYSPYGNTALKPESANSFDGGIEQHFLDGAVVLSATGFYRKTSNQIDFVSCPNANPLCVTGKSGVYDNVARARAQGVELAASATLGDLVLQSNYTYTDARNLAPGNVNYGKELIRRAKNTANATATYNWPMDVSTGVSVRYVGRTFDNAANTLVLHDYALVDLRASWQITKEVEIYGRIENAFDATYATTRNYGTLGRGLYAGVRAKY